MNEKRFKCNLNAKASEIKKKYFQMIAQHSIFDEKQNCMRPGWRLNVL